MTEGRRDNIGPEEQTEFERIIDYSLDIICSIDEEGRFTRLSPACETVWGYTPGELMGRKYIDLVFEDDLQKTNEAALSVMSGQPTWNFENRYIRKDGTLVSTSWTAMWSESDKTMFCVARDNTQRNLAEEKLQQSRRLLEKAQHLARLGSWEWDITTQQISWSDELYRVLGYEPGQIPASYQAYIERVHPEDRELVEASVRDSLSSNAPIDFDYRVVRPDGAQRIVHARGEITRDSEGRPLKVMGSTQDITERKLIEEQLERAREDAERANRARSEFLSRMSHELRTPLNAILGFAQLLEMDELGPMQRDGVEQILRGGRHLLQLINEVLDIASIDAGRLTLSSEAVQPADVVHEVTTLLSPLLSEGNLTMFSEIEATLYMKCDRHRLKQVLLNLVSNAIKYNRDGGTVCIALAEAEREGCVRLEVSDSGVGISPAGIEKLFAPFERLEALQRGVEGTGIGLTITQRLMRLMDGDIGVRSVENEGSTFWIELPVAQDPLQALELEEAAEAAGAEIVELAPRPGHTILSIEDNLSNLRLIERILERRPEIKLLAAMQGRLGLELAREHLPSLILLDLHLPDIAGDDVLRHLRAEDLTRNIPVVMVSADATPRQIERLLEIGARAYLTKPLNVTEFLRVLDDALPV